MNDEETIPELFPISFPTLSPSSLVRGAGGVDSRLFLTVEVVVSESKLMVVSGEVFEVRDRFLDDLVNDSEEEEAEEGEDDTDERTIGEEGFFEVEAEAKEEGFDRANELLRLETDFFGGLRRRDISWAGGFDSAITISESCEEAGERILEVTEGFVGSSSFRFFLTRAIAEFSFPFPFPSSLPFPFIPALARISSLI